MGYLVLAILLNVVISAMFKVFPRFGINILQAIVVNYCTCVITGLLFIGHIPVCSETFCAAWFPWSLVMGAGFIGVFYLLGLSMRVDGITTTTIANKLSLVIPALFSIFMYHELAGIGKIVGFALAFPAIYLTAHVKGAQGKPQNLALPTIIFLGGGMLDTGLKFMQHFYLHSGNSQAIFILFCFGTAGVIGLVPTSFFIISKKEQFRWKNTLAGICLGIPNYFSIYFLIRMLNSNFLQSSAIIPVFNISIVVASSVMAIVFFRERVNKSRLIGLVLSVIAILLIAFGDR